MSESNASTRMTLRTVSGIEVAAVFTSILISLWFVVPLFPENRGLVIVPGLLALGLIFYSERVRGEGLEELGLTFSNFSRAIRLLAAPTLLTALLLLGIGYWSATFRIDGSFWLKLVTLPLWGLVQQFVLQGFIHRRLCSVTGTGLLTVVITAALFALVHLPNPALTALTFIGGLFWTSVYQRAPNLFALGLSHGIVSLLVMTTVPGWLIPSLAVGYKYLLYRAF